MKLTDVADETSDEAGSEEIDEAAAGVVAEAITELQELADRYTCPLSLSPSHHQILPPS